jgi:membrane protein YqaA with SNARE-associated domain
MEEIVVIQRMRHFRRQRQGSAAAVAHIGLTPRSLLDWGIGEWREKSLSNPT